MTARRLITPALVLLALALALGFGLGLRALILHAAEDRIIADLAAGRDIPVTDNAPAPVLFARITFLTARDRLDEAQPLVDLLASAHLPALEAEALYNLANARLRTALDHLERNDIDPAIPLITLARRDYRQALRLSPGHWDARYNFDIATRLIRDFPSLDPGEGDPPPPGAQNLWNDLPGLPRGLP